MSVVTATVAVRCNAGRKDADPSQASGCVLCLDLYHRVLCIDLLHPAHSYPPPPTHTHLFLTWLMHGSGVHLLLFAPSAISLAGGLLLCPKCLTFSTSPRETVVDERCWLAALFVCVDGQPYLVLSELWLFQYHVIGHTIR